MTVVRTIREKCKRCYTCVRSCPAKAIKIAEGQAEVIKERCIGCGNCVKVCSQNAKEIRRDIEEALSLIEEGNKVAICVAPSFPADFSEIKAGQLVSALKKVGFNEVYEVGFGADLVSRCYKETIEGKSCKPYIATSCPAVVYYIEKYMPELIDSMIPIVSPMIATSKVIKEEMGDDVKVVFAGPCISKKIESDDPNVEGYIDAALTFKELREIFALKNIDPREEPEEEFTEPIAGIGSVFPISQGILKSANIKMDILDNDIVATEGKERFLEAIELFDKGELNVRLLEVLFCEGCINGPGFSNHMTMFNKKQIVSDYVKDKCSKLDNEQWKKNLEKYSTLDFSRKYKNDDMRIAAPSEEKIREIMNQTNKFTPEDELNCGSCGYDTCREQAVAIYKGLAEKEMCLPFMIEQLEQTCTELAESNTKLFQAQEQLIQSEKLTSMGQLAAGVAHEVNNPLGTVILYSHLLLRELKENNPHKADIEMIVKEATRCKTIISGLLDFSRQSKLVINKWNIKKLLMESVKIVTDKKESISVVENIPNDLPLISLDKEQIKQVFLNMFTNAVDAMNDGGTLTLEAQLVDDDSNVQIKISDTGCGIPKDNLDKVFNPFFTTKQIGKGTGLGLAVSYGIIKMHKGQIVAQSELGKGTTFIITLHVKLSDSEPTMVFKKTETV